MNIVWSIIIGLLVGLLAKCFMPGKDPGGFTLTTMLGIGGAVVANFTGNAMGWYGPGQAAGFVASIIGAMFLLLLYRRIGPARQNAAQR